MRELFKTKYFKWGITLFISLSAVVILFMLISRASGLADAIRTLGTILAPFFYGIVIAYILRPVFNGCYSKVEKLMLGRGSKHKTARLVANTISSIVSMLLFIGIIAGLMIMIVPQMVGSVIEIIRSIPEASDRFLAWVEGLRFINDSVKDIINDKVGNALGNIDSWATSRVLPYFRELALQISTGIYGVAKFLLNFFIGMIVAVYILLGKNTFSAQAKKASYSLFNGETANHIIKAARYTDRVFTNFVVGNLIDALIIGVVTLIVMLAFGWPMPVLVAAVVGVTNLIPFFGPFIGGGIGAVLILIESPLTALYFLIYILIIQQIDGNIIKPKVLGATTELSSFWVLFAILVGGGLFGIWGLLLGVPIFTLIYAMISWVIDNKLRKKNLPEETSDYTDVKQYNTESGEFELLPENYSKARAQENKQKKRERREKRKLEDK